MGAAGIDTVGVDAAGAIGLGAVRNSAGARSEVLSIVIDLPCVRFGAASCCCCVWLVGVDTTRLGVVDTGGGSMTDVEGAAPGRGGRGGGFMAVL